MIFYIGNECPATGLKQVLPRLFLDDGWLNKGTVYFKGYSTDCVLADSLDDILNGYQPAGKWCVIHDEKVYHPVLRGFPIYYRNDEQTSFQLDGFEVLHYNNLEVDLNKETLSVEEVSKRIGDILVENTRNFYKYNNPANMTVVISAGLDTLTCWAIQEQVSTDFNLSIHVPTEKDVTLETYVGIEREYHTDVMDMLAAKYWGYVHPSFYKETNWINSGFYAETYTFRDIAAATAFTKYSGFTSLEQLVTENDYYYPFVRRAELVETYKRISQTIEVSDETSLRKYLWSTIWYDHQMWHLDNNMFFCPFADLRIPELTLQLSVEDLIKIGVNGDIQRHILNQLSPEKLTLLSKYKNSGDIWGNFKANFNESMVHPNTKIIWR